MTNPSDIVRVRARLDGRASVYEANGWCQSFTTGVLSGNGVLPNTVADMNVLVGGTPDNPDVVIAENPDGYKIALDIVGQQAIAITAPASQSRISAIVAYTDDLSLQSTDANTTGSPSSCGLIVVNGNTAAIPSSPNDTTIRQAITADGATGSQACYAILALITVSSSATAITSTNIAGQKATLAGTGVVSATNIDFTTLGFGNYSTSEVDTGFTWIDGSHIYKKTITHTTGIASGTSTNISHGISNIGIVVKKEMIGYSTDTGATLQIPAATFVNSTPGGNNINSWTVTPSDVIIYSSMAYSDPVYITLYYTKTS